MQPLLQHLLRISGHGFVVLGIIGIFLPLLPTTPFLLLASACYVRSSEKHYQQLLDSPVLGSILRDYQEKHGITLKTKITSLTLLWLALAYSAYRAQKPVVYVILLITGTISSTIILRIRTLREDKSP